MIFLSTSLQKTKAQIQKVLIWFVHLSKIVFLSWHYPFTSIQISPNYPINFDIFFERAPLHSKPCIWGFGCMVSLTVWGLHTVHSAHCTDGVVYIFGVHHFQGRTIDLYLFRTTSCLRKYFRLDQLKTLNFRSTVLSKNKINISKKLSHIFLHRSSFVLRSLFKKPTGNINVIWTLND